MASFSANNPVRDRAGPGPFQKIRLWRALEQYLYHSGPSSHDDPVCLSALDDTTLRRFGYKETEINLMKQNAFR